MAGGQGATGNAPTKEAVANRFAVEYFRAVLYAAHLLCTFYDGVEGSWAAFTDIPSGLSVNGRANQDLDGVLRRCFSQVAGVHLTSTFSHWLRDDKLLVVTAGIMQWWDGRRRAFTHTATLRKLAPGHYAVEATNMLYYSEEVTRVMSSMPQAVPQKKRNRIRRGRGPRRAKSMDLANAQPAAQKGVGRLTVDSARSEGDVGKHNRWPVCLSPTNSGPTDFRIPAVFDESLQS